MTAGQTILSSLSLADFSPLANHLWQSTLCAAAVWLLTKALKKNHAGIRYWLWLTASVKFMIPFWLLVSLGSHLGWRLAQTAPFAAPHWSNIAQNISQPFTISPPIQIAAPPALHPLPAILFIAWLGGFVVSVVIWLRWWKQVKAARGGATPLPLGLAVPVMSSPTRVEPGVIGIRKPVLLLPKGIEDRLTPEQLNAVLAHEMCHVRRHDNLTAAIHMIVEAVFWFYPLVWWIRTRLIEERERACDEAVLQSGSDAEVYAEGILSVCKFYVESPLACVSGVSGSDLKERVVRIMRNHVGDRLTRCRKLLLATIGIMTLAVPVVLGAANALPSRAESQAESLTANIPAFEVATFRSTKPGDDSFAFGFFSADTFTARGTTLHQLIKGAYGVNDDQIEGAPRWVDSERYSVKAKLDESAADELRKLGHDEEALEEQRLLQKLLADRCKLAVHPETRELPIFALVLAKNGPKLHEATPGDTYPNSPIPKDLNGKTHGDVMMMGRGMLRGQGIPISYLVQMLAQQQLGRPVIDETELTGKYDFTLKWTPETNRAPSQGIDGSPPPDSGVSIFTAIQEQLGLKLESQKGPVQVLVIDHVEKPSEN